MTKKVFFLCQLVVLFTHLLIAQQNNYDIGVGISDVTGQIAQTNFFGFADVFAKNSGIRDRQYARAFIVKESTKRPIVFVCIDKGAMFPSVNNAVMEKLKALYGNLYQDDNVVISATHTHVSPGGFSHYQLYDISVGFPGGYYQTNFDILVNGIVQSIKQAHNRLAPGRIYYNTGNLYNASINRSLVAYKLNKDADKYPSIDPEMTVLKFVQGQDKEIGMISFFGVHPTSLSIKYRLCSSDNKGYAALKFERLNHATYNDDSDTFVAAFANTNAGDMSPNLNLPDPDDYSVDATGPGKDEEDSANIMGQRQFDKAFELYKSADKQLFGDVKAVSRYSDFSEMEIEGQFTDGQVRHTCKAALGTSFRAGAEDARSGIGREGNTRDINKPGSSLDHCHMEKEIDHFFNIGKNDNHPRSPKILPTSIIKIGQLGLLAGPAEFTIMCGRRIKATVAKHTDAGFDHLVLVGYSDAYSGYVTTREEYSSQQYEGASTHFGPWTLAAYRQSFDRLAKKLVNPESNPWEKAEPKIPVTTHSRDRTVKILYDRVPFFKKFGDVKKEVKLSSYEIGGAPKVTFWAGHPNNDPKTNSTYLEVQKETKKGWKPVYTDRDTNTKLIWKRLGLSYSQTTIVWNITPDVESGFYRIVHYGNWKKGCNGTISPYTGISKKFYVKGSGTDTSLLNESNKFNSLINKVSIYPNPTSKDINLLNSSDIDLTYKVVSTLGNVIESGKLPSNGTSKFTIQSAKGIYFVKFKDSKGKSFQTTIFKK